MKQYQHKPNFQPHGDMFPDRRISPFSKGNIVSVSKYLMRRPAILDWNFMERHYPDYYHSDAILKSDDMSYCLGDMGNVPCDTLITEESYKAFEEYAEDLAYRVENGFADFIGSGLTFGQAADYFDDWLYAVAVLEGEGCIQVSEAVRLWAEKVFNTPAEKRRQWYAGRLSSDPKPSDAERLLIEVANYIALKYGLVFGENGESVLDVFENILQAHLYREAEPGFSFHLKPDRLGLSVTGYSRYLQLQSIVISNEMPIAAAQTLIDILISGNAPNTVVSG
jgi:hypothetical protein